MYSEEAAMKAYIWKDGKKMAAIIDTLLAIILKFRLKNVFFTNATKDNILCNLRAQSQWYFGHFLI